MQGAIISVSILISTLFITILLSIAVAVYHKHVQIVNENSMRVKNLVELNKKYNFYGVLSGKYVYRWKCNSKRKFDNFNMDAYMRGTIHEKLDWFKTLVDQLLFNRAEFKKYESEYSELKSTITEDNVNSLKISYNTFLKIESKLFRKGKVAPVMDTSFFCEVMYTSPQGRNHYSFSRNFYFKEINGLYNDVIRNIEMQATRENQIKMERSKMTSSLRYDVLKRDNYRCKICGSSADDGVKLQVDHIVPVSKGGVTTKDNLQTLCDRCNGGKSDKE